MNIVERAANIVQTIEYLTIASVCENGMPWNTPVYTAFDKNLNFYWKSWVENQHSQNIHRNSDVFLVIYDSRAKAGTGEGIYFKAKAVPLFEDDQNDIEESCRLLELRAGESSSNYKDFFDGNPRRVYKAVPYEVWVNDGSTKNGDYIDVREALDIDQLKEEIRKFF